MIRIVATLSVAAFITGAMAHQPAHAQSYPSRPIRIIVPTSPGGPLDLVVRALGEKLSVTLKQPILVENKPGAAGNIGAELVAKSDPDGHTLLSALGTTLSVNPHVYKTMPIDVLKDLRPISNMVSASQMLVVHPSFPANSLAEFIAFAKKEPVSYAHAGHGSPGHLSMEYFALKTGIKTVPVPYRGNAPLVTDLIAGQIKAGFVSTSGVVQHVRSGRLRAFAVSSEQRSALAPDVPTVAEIGYPGFKFETYFLLLGPAGMSDTTLALLEKEVRQALQAPDLQARFAPQDITFIASTASEAAALMKAEYDLWADVAKAANMQAQ